MHIYIQACVCMCIYLRDRYMHPAIIGADVCFNNVHDNNLNNKYFYHTADFTLCDMPMRSP